MVDTHQEHLTAVYYPYSRCLDEESLKRAILIFDELVFIDPKTPKVRQGLYSIHDHQAYLPGHAAQKLPEEWEYIEMHYDSLIKEGVVSFFDPSTLLMQPSVDRLITEHMQVDMGDPTVFRLFDASLKAWTILRSRIPKSAFQYLYHQYTPRVLYDQNTKRPFSSSYDGRHHAALFADGKPDQDYGAPGMGRGSKAETMNEYACVVPYYLGSSISVSTALAVIAEKGAIPFTDSDTHHKLLALRYERASRAQSELPNGEMPGLGAPPQNGTAQKSLSPAWRIFDSVLSSEDLKAISLQQCLDYRRHTEKERQSFTKVISDITRSIEHDVWSAELERHIKVEIQKVQDAIREQEASLRKTYKDLFHREAAGAFLSTATILLTTAFPGVSPKTAFLLGAATTGVLAEPVQDLGKVRFSKLSDQKNSISILYDLKGGIT